jgi:hypothetical protein
MGMLVLGQAVSLIEFSVKVKNDFPEGLHKYTLPMAFAASHRHLARCISGAALIGEYGERLAASSGMSVEKALNLLTLIDNTIATSMRSITVEHLSPEEYRQVTYFICAITSRSLNSSAKQ